MDMAEVKKLLGIYYDIPGMIDEEIGTIRHCQARKSVRSAIVRSRREKSRCRRSTFPGCRAERDFLGIGLQLWLSEIRTRFLIKKLPIVTAGLLLYGSSVRGAPRLSVIWTG